MFHDPDRTAGPRPVHAGRFPAPPVGSPDQNPFYNRLSSPGHAGRQRGGLALLAAVALGSALLSRISPGVLYGTLKPLDLSIALTALFDLVFTREGEAVWRWGPLALHDEGIKQAFWTAVRFLLMVLTRPFSP